MKKVLKWLGVLLLTPILLFVLLAVLIYLPPVQNWLVQRVAAVASEKTGMDISVGHVSLSFPLDLAVDDVLVIQQGDTVADISRVVADVQLWPLLSSRVVVDEFLISQAKLNTLDLIPDLHVHGQVGRLRLASRGIDLSNETAVLDGFRLEDADLYVALSDTAAVDSTTSEAQWIVTFDKMDMERTRLTLALDSTEMMAYVGQGTIADGELDLGLGHYRVGRVDWKDGQLGYDVTNEPRAATGLDPNHLLVSDLHLRLDSIVYADPDVRFIISEASLRERSGLTVTQAYGDLSLDGERLRVKGLQLQTPFSHLTADTDIQLSHSVSDGSAPQQIALSLDASIGRGDMELAMGEALPATWPQWPLAVRGRIVGDSHQMTIDQLNITLPTVLQGEVSGTIENLTDASRLRASIDLDAQTFQMDPVLQFLDISTSDVRLPSGLRIGGHVDADASCYTARLTARDGEGTATLDGRIDTRRMDYEATVKTVGLDLRRFLPGQQLSGLSADINIQGRGTDLFSSSTNLTTQTTIHRLQYGAYHLDSLLATATLDGSHMEVCIESHNRLAKGQMGITAEMGTNHVKATVVPDLQWIDLYALQLNDEPLKVGFSGHLDIESNMEDTHMVKGRLTDISLRDNRKTHYPETVSLLLNTSPDTLSLQLQSGNLTIRADAPEGHEQLFARFGVFTDSLTAQLADKRLDQPSLKQLLPTMNLQIDCGRNNPLADIFRAASGLDFKESKANLTSSPVTGINGEAYLYGLSTDGLRLDTIRLSLKDSERGLTYQALVQNNRKNPQMVFKATLDGMFYEHGAYAGVHYYDQRGQLGVRIGAKATMEDEGLRLSLLPERPLLGFKEFQLNDDNYILLPRDGKLSAKVDLIADDGTGLKVYSSEQDSTLLQDITVSLNRLDLGQLTTSLPMLPRIGGQLNGDFHLTVNEHDQISVATDMEVESMLFDDIYLGNLGTELVYLQREDNTHAIAGSLLCDGEEIGMLEGEYRERSEELDATLQLTHTPLSLLNGFFEDQILCLEGFIDGSLTIAGHTDAPLINGSLTPSPLSEGVGEAARIISPPYGVTLYLDPEPFEIVNSKVKFDNFALYTTADRQAPNAINISGSVDFGPQSLSSGGGSTAPISLRMRARNCQLINARQSARSVAYGKMFINLGANITGSADLMQLSGRLDVLGTTDLTYLLLDSPLSTDNQMDELVRFTDFSDSTQVAVQRPAPEALQASLTIHIDERAHVKCALNADQSNYVDLFGGGDLRLKTNGDDLTLSGRYTLTEGSSMKYSLPVIPLKTFIIHDGSYVEFTGDPSNPRLNITATERNRATVNTADGQTRTVSFDCGVQITKTLSDMGLNFTISAPEDMTVNSELAAMSTEQRGKLAVTMLTTGMYLADGSSGGFSMNSALSSFLQSEINTITGNALKTLDLSIGMDNATDASGATHTDYSFSFAKRFWNNRLSVQIGGKVSTGSEMQGQNQSFFDNVTMEYRLSPTSNQYVKLFYKQNAYDWLDGYTGEYGGGYIWKRKLDSFWDIFSFGTKQPLPNTISNSRRTQEPLTTPQNHEADTLRMSR